MGTYYILHMVTKYIALRTDNITKVMLERQIMGFKLLLLIIVCAQVANRKIRHFQCHSHNLVLFSRPNL